jgi:hypothetical protein
MHCLKARCITLLRFATGLLLPVLLSGCAYLVTGFSNAVNTDATKTIKLSVLKSPAFVDCKDNFIYDQDAFCPAHPHDQQSVFGATLERSTYRLDTRTHSYGAGTPAAGSPVAAAAAALADEVLNDNVQAQLNDIYNVTRGLGTAYGAAIQGDQSSDAEISINVQAFSNYLEKLETATLAGGWDSLAEREKATYFSVAAQGSPGHKELEDKYRLEESKRRAQYISAYVKAYFREGHFFQATIDGAKFKQRIIAKLKDSTPGLSDAAYDELSEKLLVEFGFKKDAITFGSIASGGFVSRGGQNYAFSGLSVSAVLGESSVKVAKIDYIATGADLVRVVLSAIYDAHDGVPAVTGATGATAPEIDAANKIKINNGTAVSPEDFGAIETTASEIDGVTTAGFGRVIRGLGIVALNNEGLANAFEAAVGTSVRKNAEKILWCAYACKDADASRGALFGASTPERQQITLTLKVTGGPVAPRARPAF